MAARSCPKMWLYVVTSVRHWRLSVCLKDVLFGVRVIVATASSTSVDVPDDTPTGFSATVVAALEDGLAEAGRCSSLLLGAVHVGSAVARGSSHERTYVCGLGCNACDLWYVAQTPPHPSLGASVAVSAPLVRVVLVAPAPSSARRRAIVIGNSEYAYAPRLSAGRTDAARLGTLLQVLYCSLDRHAHLC